MFWGLSQAKPEINPIINQIWISPLFDMQLF